MSSRTGRYLLAFVAALSLGWWVQQRGLAQETAIGLSAIPVSADTGEKPQSKVWFHEGSWWAVLPSTSPSPSGTWLWRLNADNTWVSVLQLSSSTIAKADAKAVGGVTHVLLYGAASTELASVEYVPASNTYQLWTARPANTPIALPGSEIATIDVDSTGRMWLATESGTNINVYWSDAPYSAFSGPLNLASGITDDDIAVVTALPNGTVGVLWSNQTTRLFGFRAHVDGADPVVWSADEVPASQSALGVGLGMADDHLNVAVASDSTLYAAVKTSYDTAGYPKIALLVRRPQGTWDNLYQVDVNGTRGIVLLDELRGLVRVVYTASESGGDILYKESSTSAIDFSGPAATMISGSPAALNNATSTKQNWTGRVVVLATGGGLAQGVLVSREDPALVGWWPMNEGSGTTARDYSGFGGVGSFQGNPFWTPGVSGTAIAFDGTDATPDAVVVPHSSALSLSTAMTVSAWIKPGRAATQDLITKVSGSTGYALSLSSPTAASAQRIFVRLNGADTYRVNASATYPADGNTWVHAAATFDGTTIRLYINGIEDGSIAGPPAGIGTNSVPVYLGAHPTDASRAFKGQLDDVRIYSRALSAAEIASIANVALERDLAITKTDGESSVTAGQTLTYSIVAANNSAAGVTGATVADTLPASLTGATWTCVASAGSNCPASGSGNINSQVNLAGGGTATFTLHATVAAGASGAIANTASVTPPSGITDPITSNNSATDTDTVFVSGPGITTGLVGYWKMEEGAGATLLDASGNGNNAPTVGSPAWVTGKDGLALSLNGTSQYATAPHSSSLNITGPITMSAWVKPAVVGTQNLIKKATGTTASTGAYELSLSSLGTAFVRLSDGSSLPRVDSATSYPTGQWFHLAATYDGTTIRLYLNGVQNASGAGPTAAVIRSNTLALGLGAQSDGASGKLQGQLDEVRIYNRALSASEISALATNIAPVVSAGADQSVTLPATASLSGTVSDDGLPNPPGAVTVQWTKVSGPGTVTFGTPGSLTTTASFSADGAYVLRLAADDGMLTSADDVAVAVSPSGPVNLPPVVSAGADQVIALPAQATLAGSASDDGQPSGSLTVTWSAVSGPAGVLFADSHSAATTATFALAGTYGLRLTATDGALTSVDDVTVSVSDPILVGAGDIAPDCTAGASIANAQATAALLSSVPGTIFTLGDNAYQDGTAQQFSQCYGATWGGLTLKPRTRPATGNHDYNANASKGAGNNANPYFDYFNGSGSITGPAGDRDKGYYSYDLPNWHIVVLNSECGSPGLWETGGCAVGSAQEQWLRADLAASPTNNIIGMWHKPRFSSSASDSSIDFMQPLWQAMYEYGVDVVLGGHWHNYERLAPVNANGVLDTANGIRQFVVGTGGVPFSGFGTTRANSEVRQNTDHGVLKLTLHASSYDWEFIPIAGRTFTDSGTAPVHGPPPPPSITSITPAVGPATGGTLVTIAGTGFGAPSGTSVKFGAVSATSSTCASATVCTATAPAGLGTVDVTVTVGGQTSATTAADRFTYNQPPQVDAGVNQTITLPAGASLSGTVIDDGVPNPPGSVSITWTTVSGPAAVAFANANASSTTATFSTPGTYVLRLTANDGMLANSDDITVVVNPGNQAPVVDAGANQAISFPTTASLSGTATDDGLPSPPGALTLTWSKISGPGAVTFANPATLSTTATFSLPGIYVLQLSATDGALTTSDAVTITVRGLVGHWPMDEGTGTSLLDASGFSTDAALSGAPSWAPAIRGLGLTLNGTTQNGLLPHSARLNPATAITVAVWVKPAKAAFATQDLIKKAVTGTTNGYELSLAVSGKPFFRLNQVTSGDTYRANALTSYPLSSTAWQHLAATYDGSTINMYVNGVLEASIAGPAAIAANTLNVGIGAQSDATRRFEGAMDDARIYDRALDAGEIRLLANRPPAVNAGADQTVTLPAAAALAGAVADDGIPSSSITASWTQISGPGVATFSNPSAASTSASFSEAGVYVLSLAASDGDLSAADTITVTAQVPVNQAPVVSAGVDQTITLPATAALDGTATDDGLPGGVLNTVWSKVSGPGTVTFGDTTTADTTATFSVAGVYTLRLTASDGALVTADDVVITVNPVSGNYGLDFGGTNAYVTFGNPAKLHLPTFTIEAWFNRQGLGATTTTGTGGIVNAIPLVTRGRGEAESAAADTNYFLGIDTVGNVLAADFEEGAGGASPSANHPVRGVTAIPATDNRWHHAAATYDGATWRLYLDGRLETQLLVGQPAAAAGTQHAAIGSALSTTGVAAGFFDGVLDEVRIWNYARTTSEIGAALNQQIPTAAGLVARWALDEGAGTTIGDSTAAPVTGTVTGANWSWVSGAPFNLNLAPTVDAGPDQTVTTATGAALSATVVDDGLPNPPGALTAAWTQVSGPGTATFQSPAATATSVNFSAPGTYVLRFAASDGELSAADTLTIVVNSSGPVNQAPTVNAGVDQTITLPASASLAATVTDDGLPGSDIATMWTMVSGPAAVVFGDATSTGTTATFSAAGSYVLRISADDGELSSSDTLTVTVVSPASNNALDLGGTNAYVNLGPAPGLRASTFTLELWLRRDGAGVTTSTGTGGFVGVPLVSKGMAEGDGSTVDMNYFLGIRGADGVLGADFEDMATGGNHPVFGTTPIPANGTWHHAAATYDGSTWRLYLDGALQSTLAVGSFSPRADSVQWSAIGSASNSTGGVGGQTRGLFDGAVDEVRIWNYARTPQQILETINQEVTSASGLLGRWSFNAGSGTAVADSSGNGITGTVVGSNFTWVPGAPFRVNQAPAEPVLSAPADGATGIATSPTLSVGVTDPDGDAMTVTFFGRAVPAAATPDFTIVALPDTQHYVDDPSRAATFTAQTQWIVDNKTARNIAFVTHLGDIAEHIDAQPVEWERADSSLSLLEGGGLKWGLAPGNHDMSAAGVATNYDATFPVSRFSGNPWYGGYLGNDPVNDPVNRENKDNYELFSVGGLDFIILHLEYDMPGYSVDWANRILAQYPNRRAIISTHLFLNASGVRPTTVLNRTDGTPAETVWQQLIRSNCNVFLVLNGHYPGEANRTDLNACGQPVHQLASDYQSRTNGGDGWLRYLVFTPAANKIYVYTFSPTLSGGAGQYETDANSQFVLDYDMQGTPFSLIATSSGVASGSMATATWPELPAGGQFEWYVTVNDGAATTTSPTWTFMTTQPNRAPSVTNPGDQTSAEGQSVSLAVAASDPDGDALTYSATGLPAGLSMDAAGVIGGQVAFGATPSNNVVINVTDGSLSVTASFTWTVTRTNRAPELAPIGDRPASEATPLTFTLSATDPDGDALTYSATGVPAGALFDAATHTFTWTPGFDQAGAYPVTFAATDGVLIDSEAITITVANTNRAPSVTNPGDQTSAEGQSVSVAVTASDADGDALTYSATGLPAGLSMDAAGVIGGAVAFGATPSNNVVITVTDGSLSATASFTWTVTRTNRAPELAPIGDRSASEATPLTITLSATDPDGDALTYSVTGLPAGALFDAGTRTFTWTPGFDQAGAYPVTFAATDGVLIDSEAITITVANTNRAPSVTNPGDQTSAEGQSVSVAVAASDADGDALTYSATGLPAGLSISGAGVINGTVAVGAASTNNVTVTVSDGALSGSASFIWTVTPTVVPSLTINDATVIEGNSGTVNATFTITLSAASGLPVTVGYATANGTATAGADYNALSPGTLTFAPGETAKTLIVQVLGDTVDEDSETFLVNLSSPTNATLARVQGTGTITDNDAAPSLRISDVSVVEGDGGTSAATFTVTLSAVSERPVSVTYATANKTASAGSDYVAQSGSLLFAPGVTVQTIAVLVQGDTLTETNETFSVNLSGAVNASLADATGLATIVNDDAMPSLTIDNVIVTEGGKATFTITLSSVTSSKVTVRYTTANGTAVAGSDYQAKDTTISLPAGTISKTISISTYRDAVLDPDETFFVNLSAPVNAILGDPRQGTATIRNR